MEIVPFERKSIWTETFCVGPARSELRTTLLNQTDVCNILQIRVVFQLLDPPYTKIPEPVGKYKYFAQPSKGVDIGICWSILVTLV